MKFRVPLACLLLTCVALAGCFGGGGGSDDPEGDGSGNADDGRSVPGSDPAQERQALAMSPPSGYASSDDAGASGASGSSGGGASGGGSGGTGGSSGGSGGGSGSSGSDSGDGGSDGSGSGGSGGSGDPADDAGDDAPSSDDAGNGTADEPTQEETENEQGSPGLLGGLPPPAPGITWNNVRSITGVGVDASGFFGSVPAFDPENPRPPSGDDFEGWDPESIAASLGLSGAVAGYGFSASEVQGGDVRSYSLSVEAQSVREQSIRSLLLDPADFLAYVEAGGTLTDVGPAEPSLDDAEVHVDTFRVVPLVYTIHEDGAPAAHVTIYLPVDAETPSTYWAPVGMAYDDGVHAGSWEFAPRGPDDRPEWPGQDGSVAVPYMAGDSVEELAAWDVLLALHGVELYAQYPSQGVPLPAPGELPAILEPQDEGSSEDDGSDAWGLESVDDPTGLTGQQVYVFGHDARDVPGLLAAYQAGMTVHHQERAGDGVQWFRVGLAPGLPVPLSIEVGRQSDDGTANVVRVDLDAVGDAVADLPGVPEDPGVVDGVGEELDLPDLPLPI